MYVTKQFEFHILVLFGEYINTFNHAIGSIIAPHCIDSKGEGHVKTGTPEK